MTKYNVHIYREMRLRFDGIAAESPEAAAEKARDMLLKDTDDFDECDGENLAALVDVVGDEDYSRSVTIDFEAEQHRKAASKLLVALKDAANFINGFEGDELQEGIDDVLLPRIRSAIAKAEAAGISSAPPAPGLLAALQAVLPFAENERASLRECWKRDDDPKVKEELDACDRALDQAASAIAEAKAAGIVPATGDRPARFRFTHEPEEDPDRAYVLVDGLADVKIVRTGEGIVIDVYSDDGIDVIGTLAVWNEDLAKPEPDAAEGA
jgi:hypothetical protein